MSFRLQSYVGHIPVGHILVICLLVDQNFPKRICNTPLTCSYRYDYENVSTSSVCKDNDLSLRFDIHRHSQRGIYEKSQYSKESVQTIYTTLAVKLY